jgi:Ribulose-5-phosphate 4-epimerase and related epimerases and aldolases
MLEALKRRVIEVATEAENEGLCRHKSGNFSMKDAETGYIVVTPSGVKRCDLNEDAIIVVDIEGNVIENKSTYKATSELPMHLVAYKTRPDISAVCHTHALFATVFAVQSKEIKPVVFEAYGFGGSLPIAKYGTPGTMDLANSIIEPLKKADACLLEKHGALTVGTTIEDAFLKMQYVEDVAQIYFYSLQLGKEPDTIPQKEFDAVSHR